MRRELKKGVETTPNATRLIGAESLASAELEVIQVLTTDSRSGRVRVSYAAFLGR